LFDDLKRSGPPGKGVDMAMGVIAGGPRTAAVADLENGLA
jgi:hypothetical protein